MKTTIVFAASLLPMTSGYNSPLRRLGDTPQPSYWNSYNKPEKSGSPIPWMPLNGNGKKENSGMPFGMPPIGMPFPMGLGVPIAPDPNPNDEGPWAGNHPFHIPEQMHHEDPAVFSNEDSWAWRAEQHMHHPPHGHEQQDHVDFDNTQAEGQAQGHGHNPMSMDPFVEQQFRQQLEHDFQMPSHEHGHQHPQHPHQHQRHPQAHQQGIPDWRLQQHFGNDPNTHYHEGYYNDKDDYTNNMFNMYNPNQKTQQGNQQQNNNGGGVRRRLVRYRPKAGPPLSSLDPHHHHQEQQQQQQQGPFLNQGPPLYRPMEDPNHPGMHPNMGIDMPMGMDMGMDMQPPPPYPHPAHPYTQDPTYFHEPQFYPPPPGVSPNFDYDWFYNGHSSYTQRQEGDIDGLLYY